MPPSSGGEFVGAAKTTISSPGAEACSTAASELNGDCSDPLPPGPAAALTKIVRALAALASPSNPISSGAPTTRIISANINRVAFTRCSIDRLPATISIPSKTCFELLSWRIVIRHTIFAKQRKQDRELDWQEVIR